MLAHQLKQSKEKLKQDKDLFFFPINLEQLSLETETTVMAFRSVGNLRSLMGGLRGSTATYATSTTPKGKSYAPTAADYAHFQEQPRPKLQFPKPVQKGDFVPVCMAIGMIALSVSLGLVTATQQLARSPNVYVRKKTRETVPEVNDPDKVVSDAEKFLNKSFFRKVAHVQEFDYGDHPVPDPIRKDAYAHKHRVETLKSVGIDPKQV